MIRIQILPDGSVTGDVGRVMAYQNQTYSEPITVLHPSFKGAIYKLIYKWGHTSFCDLLDASDQTKLHIHGAGRVKLQFVAENVLTGEVYLASKPFDLIVHQALDAGPNNFISGGAVCGGHSHHSLHNYGWNGGCNPDPSGLAEMVVKLGIELAEETRIRSEQDSLIWEEMYKIKNALADAGFVLDDGAPKTYDCNTLVQPREYNLDNLSTNVPISGKEFKVQVRRYTSNILQTAYLIAEGKRLIFYRTGVLDDARGIVWTDWMKMVHETSIKEV